MKKIVTLVALVSIILSSCTSSKNSMVVKRKYNKGFYIAHNHKKNNVETTDSKTKISSAKSVTASKSEELAVVFPSISLISEKATYNSPEIKNTTEIKKNNFTDLRHNTVLVDSKNITASAGKAAVTVKHEVINVEKKSRTASKSDSDTNLIILIIFCFFPILSLVAMYLHDGNSITLNFWIDLLLYLTFIGYIIFALLVVLGIINLA